MENQIIIKPKYTLKDHLDFMFKHTLNNWGFKLSIFMAFVMLIFDILYLFRLIDTSIFMDGNPKATIIFPALILFIFPLSIYFITKKSFENNFRLKEEFSITFNSENIHEKGETFDVKTPWNTLKSIKETKSFFLIKHKIGTTSFYPKRFFIGQQLLDFKELIISINIKNKLR